MSQILLVDNIKEGMVVAESLTNSFGQILLPAGTKIRTNHIRVLKTWNIRSLKIKNDENEENVLINQEMINIAQKEMLKRLNWMPKNDFEKELYRIGVFQTALNLSNKHNSSDD